MILVMRSDATENDITRVSERIKELGFKPHLSKGVERTVIGAIGHEFPELQGMLEVLHGVEDVFPILKPYKLASRDFQPADTTITVGGVTLGSGELVVIADPVQSLTFDNFEQLVSQVADVAASVGRRLVMQPVAKPASQIA
ncbi:MAG: Phospho-2-dehydro-3-deoxyheptonate aldolase [Chloroflexi bacterium]|nr:Phospho-2-dehydro-3-deoxyheptonate aldolase [Chloroflexota bacterium]